MEEPIRQEIENELLQIAAAMEEEPTEPLSQLVARKRREQDLPHEEAISE